MDDGFAERRPPPAVGLIDQRRGDAQHLAQGVSETGEVLALLVAGVKHVMEDIPAGVVARLEVCAEGGESLEDRCGRF